MATILPVNFEIDAKQCSICFKSPHQDEQRKWVYHNDKNGKLHPFHGDGQCFKYIIEKLSCPTCRANLDISKVTTLTQRLGFYKRFIDISPLTIHLGFLLTGIFVGSAVDKISKILVSHDLSLHNFIVWYFMGLHAAAAIRNELFFDHSVEIAAVNPNVAKLIRCVSRIASQAILPMFFYPKLDVLTKLFFGAGCFTAWQINLQL